MTRSELLARIDALLQVLDETDAREFSVDWRDPRDIARERRERTAWLFVVLVAGVLGWMLGRF